MSISPYGPEFVRIVQLRMRISICMLGGKIENLQAGPRAAITARDVGEVADEEAVEKVVFWLALDPDALSTCARGRRNYGVVVDAHEDLLAADSSEAA